MNILQRITQGERVFLRVTVAAGGAPVCTLTAENGEVLAVAARTRVLADWALECGARAVVYDYDLGTQGVRDV